MVSIPEVVVALTRVAILTPLASSIAFFNISRNIFPSFPKVMTVTNDGKNWFTRVVIAIKNDGKVICWKNATNLEDSDKECETEIYLQATDTVFLTKKEIAKKFGLPNNDFSII